MTDTPQPHHQKPNLRPVRAMRATQPDGSAVIALQDRSMLSNHAIGISAAAIDVLVCMDGSATLDEIAQRFGLQPDALTGLVQALDNAMLLHGPVFDEFLEQRRSEFDALTHLPVRAAAQVSADQIDQWLRSADGTSGITTIRRITGMVVPHLEYDRGADNYAAGWALLRNAPRPDRVIVLGTNHFGNSTGVVLCTKGYQTQLGPVNVDEQLAQLLAEKLGPAATQHQLDHLNEHSVELQMPWIRHVLGPDVPIVGLLIHDPTFCDGQSYDGQGVALDAFLGALNEALESLGGNTLIITSADLSHVGQEFGDPEPLNPDWLARVEKRDREHLDMLVRGDVDRFVDSMTTSGNPTHWCTLGGMVAIRRLLPDHDGRLVRYEQSIDNPDGGVCCVSSAAMVLTDPDRKPSP